MVRNAIYDCRFLIICKNGCHNLTFLSVKCENDYKIRQTKEAKTTEIKDETRQIIKGDKGDFLPIAE